MNFSRSRPWCYHLLITIIIWPWSPVGVSSIDCLAENPEMQLRTLRLCATETTENY